MEKEKRKNKPKRRWIILSVTILILASLCGAFSYYISHTRSLSEFSHFETEEEVVAFLHEQFEFHVTTSVDILTFMDDYPLIFDECRDSAPTLDDFANNIVDEEATKIMNCTVPTWGSIAGTFGYTLRFYMNSDDRLVYISASRFCMCL